MPGIIVVKIDGSDVRPDTVSLADLSEVLRYLHSAFQATAVERGAIKSEVQISLSGIREGSEFLDISMDSTTYRHALVVKEAIATRNGSLLPDSARKSVVELQKKARARRWSFTFNNGDTVVAEITPDSDVFDRPIAEGTTSLIARVVRIGGEVPTAKVKLTSGEVITATVNSTELAEQLAHHLYQWVEIHGKVRWRTHNWSVDTLKIEGIGPYVESNSNPRNALNELSDASEGFWDRVDPGSHINDLREN